jgi:hypothetical protein
MRLFRSVLLLLTAFAMTGCDNRPTQSPATDTTKKSEWETAGRPVPTTSTQGYPRYQIIFSPHLRADTFLLDTQKGRIWQMTKFTYVPGQPDAWNEMDIIDSQGEIGMTYSEFEKQYAVTGEKNKKSKKQLPWEDYGKRVQ